MDIQIAFNGSIFDFVLAGADLATDAGLQTAVVISLFTDRRADAGDELPDGTTDRRGWWPDTLGEQTDRIGSKLWLLSRAKQTQETALRAENYAREALQWLVSDGIAKTVTVAADWVAQGVLRLQGTIERPDGSFLTFVYDNLWEAMHAV
jgi:phage gp46-like protein